MRSRVFEDIEEKLEKLVSLIAAKYSSKVERMSFSLVSLEEFHRKENILTTYFTTEEISYCKNRVFSLAGRYAAKIAIRRVLQKRIAWKDMNILSAQSGEPLLLFSDNVNKYFIKRSLPRVSISISHEENLVTAFAVSTTDENRVAVGIDAASISRMSGLATQTKVLKKILTSDEIEETKNLQINIAEKWAGKEAVSKAIGMGIWHGASLHEMEIITRKERPLIKLHGKVLEQARNKSLRQWELAFVRNKSFILAFALATD